MMERISIFNYEAFYLDFLEGNLNEEDSTLLMAFLEANPDLRMGDEMLPAFTGEDIKLDPESKNELKQLSNKEIITAENLEYFMIASAEGLLDESKSAELKAFIGADKTLKKEAALFSAVYFEADASITYAEKDELKRKVVVLWQYVTVAAAASVIAFFFLWSTINNDPVIEQPGTFVAEDGQPETSDDEKKDNAPLNEDTYENDIPAIITHYEATPNQGLANVQETPNDKIEDRPSNSPIDRMERKPVGHILTALNDRDVLPIADRAYPTETKTAQPEDYAAAFSEMENPIEPITEFVGNKTNREVDFRRAKNQTGKSKGFFLKIGKFEISRKKH